MFMTPDTAQAIPFVPDAPYPSREANFVRPLIDGVPAFRRICAAIDAAQHSIFVTVAFIHQDFLMPDGRGSFFDVLDAATRRGIDVRVIFWRTEPHTAAYESTCFIGTLAQREMLRVQGSTCGIRWAKAGEAYCHHQKSWIIDAGQPTEVAFVGGMNLNPRYVVSPGHADHPDGAHDVYLEIAGPAATDIHHNFVQRWNEASERHRTDGVWGEGGREDLSFPLSISAPRGASRVQIQRTVLARSEHTIFTQYTQAIDAAQRTIYIENHAFADPHILDRLHAALHRGVRVVALVPSTSSAVARRSRWTPESHAILPQLCALRTHDKFTMVGIAARQADGGRSKINIHAKVMLVDDVFATIGSCNIRTTSFFRQTEINASLYDPKVVQALRCELFDEHLSVDTRRMEDVTALCLYAETARLHAECRDDDWQGNVFAFS
jgi:phosphatidylserine/phosphatidylglycerophosphate/cardiolipin synthase-like enzyme